MLLVLALAKKKKELILTTVWLVSRELSHIGAGFYVFWGDFSAFLIQFHTPPDAEWMRSVDATLRRETANSSVVPNHSLWHKPPLNWSRTL